MLCVERNTGHDAHFLSQCLEVFPNSSVIEQKEKDAGWWSTPESKFKQLDAADSALGCKQVRIMKNWIMCNAFTKEEPNTRRNKLIKQLEEELKRYDRHELDPSRSGKQTVIISGKIGEEGQWLANVQDDLAFAFCFALWLNVLIVIRLAPGVAYERIFGS